MRQRILIALCLGLLTDMVLASDLNIWPMKILLWPQHVSDSLHLTNQGDDPVNLQISAKSWDMNETGKFIEVDTGDFVFFPRLTTIPPHTAKDIRVGYQGDFPKLEKPYRLYVEELPPVLTVEQQKQRAKLGIQYLLELSLPVFVMPDEVPPNPELTVDGIATGTIQVAEQPRKDKANGRNKKPLTKSVSVLKIGIRAPGTHHVQISKLEAQLSDTSGNILAQGQADPHIMRILPHRRVFIEVPLDTKACARSATLLAKVYAEGLTAPYEQRIPLVKGMCQTM